MTDTIYIVTVPAVGTLRRTYPAGTRYMLSAWGTSQGPEADRAAAQRDAAKVAGGEVSLMSELEYGRLVDRGGILYPAA